MFFDEVFKPFIDESPVSVMFRGTLEAAFSSERLDQIFEGVAHPSHRREAHGSRHALDRMTMTEQQVEELLVLGLLGLGGFLWAVRSGQFDDLDGAAHRILDDRDPPSSDA